MVLVLEDGHTDAAFRDPLGRVPVNGLQGEGLVPHYWGPGMTDKGGLVYQELCKCLVVWFTQGLSSGYRLMDLGACSWVLMVGYVE